MRVKVKTDRATDMHHNSFATRKKNNNVCLNLLKICKEKKTKHSSDLQKKNNKYNFYISCINYNSVYLFECF